MTCIKTGAQVYFENYGMLVPADLYVVGDCVVIRWNKDGYRPPTKEEMAGATHSVFLRGANLWHREDLGVTVVPANFIRTLPQPEESQS